MTPRDVPEREIAVALVLEYAEENLSSFSMFGFYDDDAEFVEAVAERLGLRCTPSFCNKMRRVVRRLVQVGALSYHQGTTHKEYVGEPAQQRNYSLPPGKVNLLRKGQTEHTMTPRGEAEFLVRRAYPKADE